MKFLIVAGAGTSIELGVPGMVGLAEEFIEHSKQWGIEPELVQQILRNDLDIEHLIEELDRICTARSSLELVGQPLGDCERFDKVRAEIEWFIQHAAERILPREAHLMWGAVLQAATKIQLTIVTTNYDRAIELASNAERISLSDGFAPFQQREITKWEGFQTESVASTLVKLHGSTDWYSDNATGSPVKLRHPMPLFGRAYLRLPDGTDLGSALILPSREKLLTRDPYPRLSQAFLNASDRCDIAVIVGSSLRDCHLRDAAQSIARRVPLFVVSPEGSTHGIEGAMGIAQSASAFLVGTLPGCIAASDAAASLEEASRNGAKIGNTLEALRAALDQDQASNVRCRAVEELEIQSTKLSAMWLKELIECADANVARYALGLILQSPDREQLLAAAVAVPHATGDVAFSEDLHLLQEMLAF